MIKYRSLLARLRDDEKGAYLIEFALIMPVFLLTSMGIFDLGYDNYIRSAAQGKIDDAARSATLETYSLAALDDSVKTTVQNVNPGANLTFQRQNYQNFQNVNEPENFTDGDGDGIRDPGECFEDLNGNSQWDNDVGSNGNGGAQDVVEYIVTIEYGRIFPFWKMIGKSQEAKITVSSLLRNQPFSAQAARTAVRICT